MYILCLCNVCIRERYRRGRRRRCIAVADAGFHPLLSYPGTQLGLLSPRLASSPNTLMCMIKANLAIALSVPSNYRTTPHHLIARTWVCGAGQLFTHPSLSSSEEIHNTRRPTAKHSYESTLGLRTELLKVAWTTD